MRLHNSVFKTLMILFLCSNASALTQASDSLKFTSFDIPEEGSLTGMNDQGEVIGTISNERAPDQAFIRRANGEIVKMDNQKMSSRAVATSGNGTILGTFSKLPYNSNPNQPHVFMLASDGKLDTFALPSYERTALIDINDANVILGYTTRRPETGTPTAGFVRHPNGDIEQFNGGYMSSIYPKKINKDGTVVGFIGSSDRTARSSFVRTPQGAITTFKAVRCDDCRTRAVDINDNGIIVGDHGDRDDYEAYKQGFIRMPDGQITSFSIPNGEDIRTSGINNDNIVVGNVVVGGVKKGFIRKPDGSIITIQYPDAKKTWIFDINNHGLIFGEYVDQNNREHGFLLDIN